MSIFATAVFVIAVIILIVLSVCVSIAIVVGVAGLIVDLLAPGRGRREAFRHAATGDDLTALADATGCRWCDTGTGDCTCTTRCTFIPGCHAEWTTTARAWTDDELAALRGDQELPR